MLVQTWLEGAWNRCTINDPGKLADDGELIVAANRLFQRTYPLAARSRPDEYTSQTTMVLGGAPPAGALVSSLIDLLQVYSATGAKINVYPATNIQRGWVLAPAMYRLGNSLVSRNKIGDPLAGDVLTVLQLDPPATLTSYASVTDSRFPQRHDQLLVDLLAQYLSDKDAGRDNVDRQALAASLNQSIQAFLSEYQLQPADVQWMHAGAERAGVTGRGSST